MGAADLKVMGTFGPRLIVGRIFRSRFRAGCIQLGEGNRFQVWRGKHAAIERVERVRRIVPVGDPNSWADLPFVALVLDGIPTDSHVEGPMLIGSPLILNPELLAPADQPI